MKQIYVLVILMLAFPLNGKALLQQETFNSPDEAVQALIESAGSNDLQELNKIFGPTFVEKVSSGDKTADQYRLRQLSERLKQKHQLVPGKNGKQVLEVGEERWPFPAPLIQQGGKWRFDGIAGAEEVIDRRIGENELRTINVARFYVEAQRLYHSKPRNGGSQPQYAKALMSSPGKKDGLYWVKSAQAGVSPLDPLVMRAMEEGYTPGKHEGIYQGYHYRILTKQGPAAPGGAKSYLSRSGQMTDGFALLAYPVRWGVSGIMSFIVSSDGVVYQKNLGDGTEKEASKLGEFNPDSSWERVQ